jgi:hypothetical protein
MPKLFVPTVEQRRQVKALVGFGLSHEQICKVTYNPETGAAIDKKTLYLHFPEELATGHITAVARVAESLFKIATEDPDSRTRMGACCFWLARRAGWKETVVSEHVGEDGATIEVADIRERISAKIAKIHREMAGLEPEDDLTSRPYPSNGAVKH